jgi:xanthine dehydrogenase accessory factor
LSASEAAGFLSGGCLEADVAGHAEAVIASGEPARLVYGRGSPWPDIHLLCGAHMEVMVEAIGPDDPAALALLALSEARVPTRWLSDGRRRACGTLDHPPKSWPGAFALRQLPAVRLIVVGADPTALAIAMLGVDAGHETTLVRPKGPPDGPPIAGLGYRRDEPAEALTAIGLDAWTAVAVATHEMELDHDALLVALPSPAFFVGALGARRRAPDRRSALAGAGLTPQQIGRLHNPIGLNLGGKAPVEVAVAVLAQITALKARL